jgi:hypothetical protein
MNRYANVGCVDVRIPAEFVLDVPRCLIGRGWARYDLMNSVRAAVLAHAASTPGIDCSQSMAPRSGAQ